jgi:hypothetical protein
MSAPGNAVGSRHSTMVSTPFDPPITTDTPALELFIEVANASQEIAARLTARACDAIADPTRGPAVRAVLAELLEVLDRDGWI